MKVIAKKGQLNIGAKKINPIWAFAFENISCLLCNSRKFF